MEFYFCLPVININFSLVLFWSSQLNWLEYYLSLINLDWIVNWLDIFPLIVSGFILIYRTPLFHSDQVIRKHLYGTKLFNIDPCRSLIIFDLFKIFFQWRNSSCCRNGIVNTSGILFNVSIGTCDWKWWYTALIRFVLGQSFGIRSNSKASDLSSKSLQ